ncbi:MAG: adenylyl-sulfate kinase [Sedimentisphaerales bacterium]|nr:adenylyl-sulfate kinase [Sedimentisphaerales bacterium]
MGAGSEAIAQIPDLLRLAAVGSVDDGKSTLIGRLLVDCEVVCTDHLATLETDSRRLNRQEADLAFLTDGLKAEREQGITIDVAYRTFATAKRRFLLADTPGHEQYTRNMVTGASTAELAVLLLDADRGLTTQSKRHGFIASLLGVPHILLAVNKMDLVGYSEAVFAEISEEYKSFASRLRISSLACIPVSALCGDNVVQKSARMPWYAGPTLLDYMESLYVGSSRNMVDFRFPVQLVLRPGSHFRGYAGTVLSGLVRVGDEVLALPSRHSAKVQSILSASGPVDYAFPPQAIALVLDRQIDLSRGDMLVHPKNQPHVAGEIEAMLIWMHEKPCLLAKPYLIKHTTHTVKGTFANLHYRVNPSNLHREPAPTLGLNEIGRVDVHLFRPLLCDEYQRNRATGGFAVIDPLTNETVGVGLVIERAAKQPGTVQSADHHGERAVCPKAVTIWLTGLSGSGKSTVASLLMTQLAEQERPCYVLDGDVLREGLNRDLGFSREDRSENIRRTAEVAKLMNDAGVTVIVALISPFREDRATARSTIGPDRFVEVFIDAPLDICESRDPKGLYAKARNGQLPDFTGISSPYEPPKQPDLHLRTATMSPEECAGRVTDHLGLKGRCRS